jgi:hypothetical protein
MKLVRRKSSFVVGAVFAILMCGYLAWPSIALGPIEERLVGTWRFEDAGMSGGDIYTYVFREDRTMSGVILVGGTHPQSDWDGKWRIEGTDLWIEPQGIGIPIRFIYQVLGRKEPPRPMPIKWKNDDEMLLDRGGREPDVLIRLKD